MYAIKAMTNRGQACIKEIINGFEISVAFDDSCGVMQECYRADIRVFNTVNNKDITNEVFNTTSDVIQGTFNNFSHAVQYCNTHFAKR